MDMVNSKTFTRAHAREVYPAEEGVNPMSTLSTGSKVVAGIRPAPPNAGKGRPPGVPNRVTARVRSAVAELAESLLDKVPGWIEAGAKDDPLGAARLYLAILEYCVPKVDRAGYDSLRRIDERERAGAMLPPSAPPEVPVLPEVILSPFGSAVADAPDIEVRIWLANSPGELAGRRVCVWVPPGVERAEAVPVIEALFAAVPGPSALYVVTNAALPLTRDDVEQAMSRAKRLKAD